MICKDGRRIGEGAKPYIVAELNSSHSGSVDVAKQMIDAAAAAGCDAVKFQSWSADSLYASDYYRQNPVSGRMVSKFALSQDQLYVLAEYCGKTGIAFSSTPYCRAEVDFLADAAGAAFIKVASMDLNNPAFLKYIAGKGMPVVLSTGMGSPEEIDTAVKAIESEGNTNLCILHCVSVYPARADMVNLNNLRMLQDKYPDYVVGYSDHTTGCGTACAAVTLGAAMIEKHFTLDNKKIGWDNQMATEPEDMKLLVEACLDAWRAPGSYVRIVSEEEKQQRLKMRRSIVAARDLKKGQCIQPWDLDAKRPGTGIPPERIYTLTGRKAARDIGADQLISEEDVYD